MDKWAVVCRCEEITRAEIEEAVRDGARTVDDVKRITRSGMGYCQSKFCSRTVQTIIEEMCRLDRGAVSPMRLRPPVRPIPLGVLASGREGGSGLDSLTRLFGGNNDASLS